MSSGIIIVILLLFFLYLLLLLLLLVKTAMGPPGADSGFDEEGLG